MISVIKTWLRKHQLLTLLGFFLLFQLFFLTKLPVFNDEAIYLDWAWRETHVPGFLFYSLYDAKQPLLMWLFGIVESLFNDPLFAGRLIGVVASILSGWGIYKLSSLYTDKKYSLLSVTLFSLVPLNFFYNRQALMESSMLCVGIWMGYYTLRILKSTTYNEAIILGLITGFGYFIKSTTLIFLVSSLVILLLTRARQKEFRLFFIQAGALLGIAFCCDILLFIQPIFWQTLGSNNRYVLSLSEMITQSPSLWLSKISSLSLILFWGITPIVLLVGVIGGFHLFVVKKTNQGRQLVWYFIIAFVLQFFFARSINSRYVVPFLGIFSIFVLYELSLFGRKTTRITQSILIILLFIFPVGLSILQWINPRAYLTTIPLEDNKTYLYGQTSGFGIPEAVGFLKQQIGEGRATIGVALQSGNPESSVIMHFEKNNNVHAAYFDSQSLGNLTTFDCLTADHPVYFVSRNEELVGLDKFLMKIKTIHQVGSSYSIGIYTLKSPCQGKTTHITEQQTYEN